MRFVFFLAIGCLYLMISWPRGATAQAILRRYPDAGELRVTNAAVALPEVRLAVADLSARPGGFYRLATNTLELATLRPVLGETCTTLWIRPDREIWLCPDRATFRTEDCWVFVTRLPGPELLDALGRGRTLEELTEHFGRPRSVVATKRRTRFLRPEIAQITATWMSLGTAPGGDLGVCKGTFDLTQVRGRWVTTAARWQFAPAIQETTAPN